MTILISDGQQMVVVFYDLWFLMKGNQTIPVNIGDVWQLNFKPIGLIISRPDINIYDYGSICEGIPNNCYFVTSTYETGILDLPRYYLQLPSNIPKTLDIRRQGFRVMPSEAATSYFY